MFVTFSVLIKMLAFFSIGSGMISSLFVGANELLIPPELGARCFFCARIFYITLTAKACVRGSDLEESE